MVVSDPEKAKDVLRANGFSAMLTDVVAVQLENKVGMLHGLLHVIQETGLNIEYMYALASTEIGAMIIKTSDGAKAVEALQQAGLHVLNGETIYHIK